MGLFDRLERSLERAVNGAFAKAFKSSVQPVEIASAMRRAMDDRAAETSRLRGRTATQATVPNMFTVELSTQDYDDLTAQADDLTDELLASAEEHMESQRYRTAGPMRIIFAENTDLDTGVFTLRPASARRPFDITPDGLAERSVPAHHGYEEFAEMSIGMPVIRQDAEERNGAERDRYEARDYTPRHRPADASDDEPRAWGTTAEGNAPDGVAEDSASRSGRSGGLMSAAAGAVGGFAAATGLRGAASPSAPDPRDDPRSRVHDGRDDDDDRSRRSEWDEPDDRSSRDEWDVPSPERHVESRRDYREHQATRSHAADAPPQRPSISRRPWLDIDGDRYPLLGALTVIGRDHASDIVLDDPGISRRHAELRVTTDGPHPVIALTDLGSTNGVYVNGERVKQAHVTDGDRITLGRSSMTLRTGR